MNPGEVESLTLRKFEIRLIYNRRRGVHVRMLRSRYEFLNGCAYVVVVLLGYVRGWIEWILLWCVCV